MFPITDEMGLALAAMVKASDGFKSWAEAAAPEFKALGEGWDISADIPIDVESMQAFAGQVVGAMLRSWTTQLQRSAAQIEDLCHPHALLHSSCMMGDKASQQSLATSSKKLHESNLLHIASEQLAVLKNVENEVEDVGKLPGRAQLTRWRRLGRVMLAINWAIDQVTGFVPQKPSDLEAMAEKVEGKLKQKGFKPSTGPQSELPSYIWNCLAKMRAEAAKVLTQAASSAS